jgi:hypothetical protein
VSETKIFKKIFDSRRSEVNKPRRICEDNVMMNVREMGYEVKWFKIVFQYGLKY